MEQIFEEKFDLSIVILRNKLNVMMTSLICSYDGRCSIVRYNNNKITLLD